MRRYTHFDDMKADEYRYWQSRPAHERLDALEEMIQTAYAVKGWELEPDTKTTRTFLSAFHAHGVRSVLKKGSPDGNPTSAAEAGLQISRLRHG
jgi:hypothetical protein